MCETYYLAKPSLENLCVRGRTLFANGSERASSSLSFDAWSPVLLLTGRARPVTQGAWFLHRLLHLPQASGGRLSDVVDTAKEALELAKGPNVRFRSFCTPEELDLTAVSRAGKRDGILDSLGAILRARCAARASRSLLKHCG